MYFPSQTLDVGPSKVPIGFGATTVTRRSAFTSGTVTTLVIPVVYHMQYVNTLSRMK